MAWKDDDNKDIRGPIDQVKVSETESWEIDYFIEKYLNSRGFKADTSNKDLLKKDIDKYPGKPPLLRDELEKYLDKLYGKTTS